MASLVRSSVKSKKVIRRASRSPKRQISPSRVQQVTQLESGEPVYSDPVNFSRSSLSDVLVKRHDRGDLSPQATELFNSQTVFEEEAERSWLLENIRSTTISIQVDHIIFSINANYALREDRPTVLCLHGFGAGRNWSNWIKLAYPLGQGKQYSIIFVDLPGFGLSSGRVYDQTSWKRYGPEILIGILSSFHLRNSVSVVAQCGGAATTVRTINRYPQWFRDRGLIFCNSVIGDFGEPKVGDFEANLTRYNIRVVVFWTPDVDHPKHCVAYKRWHKLRLAGFRNLQLVDFDPATQKMKGFYPEVRVSHMSQCASKNAAIVYKLSDEYVQQIMDILENK